MWTKGARSSVVIQTKLQTSGATDVKTIHTTQKIANTSSHSFVVTIKVQESRGGVNSNLLLDTAATSHINPIGCGDK